MTISSVGDYLNIIKGMDIDHENTYYRGQSSNKYDVTSSLCRYLHENLPKPKKSASQPTREQFTDLIFSKFINHFPIYSDIHTLQNYHPNELDLLISAQHYGLITRLIDFSKSPLVALYFATEKVKKGESCSVILTTNTRNHWIASCTTDQFSRTITTEKKTLSGFYDLFISLCGSGSTDYFTDNNLKEYENIFYKYNNPNKSRGFQTPRLLQNFCCSAFFSAFNPKSIKSNNTTISKIAKTLDKNNASNNYNREISSISLMGNTKYIINSLPISPRVRNQQGVLLFSNIIDQPLYSVADFNASNIIERLVDRDNINKNIGYYRIDITCENALKIHQELELYGISEEFIYPELQSFTKNLPDKVLKSQISKNEFFGEFFRDSSSSKKP